MAENNRFNNADVLHMQQDAMRRVREMQERANAKLRQTQKMMGEESTPSMRTNSPAREQGAQRLDTQEQRRQEHESTRTQKNAAVPSPGEAQRTENGITSLLERFGMDGEKAVLLLLIVLLLNEGADTKLILALCYLLI